MKHSLKKECLRHLRDTFGLTEYRPGQKDAVYALLSGRDVMCVMPTGSGKSLCWQLPAIVHTGVTVVVSPLIALMRDQVQHLDDAGIPAVTLDSLMSTEERKAAISRLSRGEARIIFVSPERLENRQFVHLCQALQPWLFVVDEAHCIVQWGDSFRPAYGAIVGFLQQLNARPVICAMTATADKTAQREIQKSLWMHRSRLIMLPPIRDNLIYSVHTTLDRTGEILRLQHHIKGKTVVFCRSRARTEQLARILVENGIQACAYHAGMERSERLVVQQNFIDADNQVLCATKAFGMGVDIPDIRLIIHDQLPDDLIDYAQQTGRAGRDGKAAECILLFEPNDLVNRVSSLCSGHHKPGAGWFAQKLETYRKRMELQSVLSATLGAVCIPAEIAKAFGYIVKPCGCCSACKRGRLVSRMPGMTKMREWHIRAWLLQWQREVLSRKSGCKPAAVIADDAIVVAAKKLVLPNEVDECPEMERLLQHFRRDKKYE